MGERKLQLLKSNGIKHIEPTRQTKAVNTSVSIQVRTGKCTSLYQASVWKLIAFVS